MKLLHVFLVVVLLGVGALGYNIPIMRKRQVDMRSFSLYDFPEDYYLSNHEAQRNHYVNPKPGYITAFYPIYDFGRRRRR